MTKTPTAAHKKLADLAVSAARMHRDVAVYADDKMGFRIMRALASAYPHVRLSPLTNRKKLMRLSAEIAASCMAKVSGDAPLPAKTVLEASDDVFLLITNEFGQKP